MCVLMFWLNWAFALLAAAVSPFLLWFVSRHKRALKDATEETRSNESEIVAMQVFALESQRVVKALGTREFGESRLREVSKATVQSALRPRIIKAFVSPAVAVIVSMSTAFVLWRGGLVVAGAMTAGRLTVFLSYLSRFFKPIQDLAKMTNAMAQAAVAEERVQAILETVGCQFSRHTAVNSFLV